MTKLETVVKQAINELNNAVKDIKQSDEDDLNELASKFDALSAQADQIANRLAQADQALSGSSKDDQDETEDENGAARNRRHGADAGCTRHRIQPSCTPDGRASMQPTRHAIPCLAKLSLGIMTLAPRVRPRTRQARPTPRSGSRAAQTAVGPDHHFRLYAIVR